MTTIAGTGNGLVSGLRPVYHFFQMMQMRAIEPGDIDDSVKPCEDFFRYANGKWLAGPVRPARNARRSRCPTR